MSLPELDCSHCALYAELRGPRILAEIRKTTSGEREVGRRWVGFLKGYHEIHGDRQDNMRRLAGRYVALMALVTEGEPETPEVVAKVGGSDARPGPPKGRPAASRSARPSERRNGRRHGGTGPRNANEKKD